MARLRTFALSLLLFGASTALAAGTNSPIATEEGTRPPWASSADDPLAGSRGVEQLENAASDSRAEYESDLAQRDSAAGRSERQRSRDAHADTTASESRALFEREFAHYLRPARVEAEDLMDDGASLVRYVSDRGMRITDAAGEPKLVQSSLPLRVPDESGALKAVDLSLTRDGDTYRPAAPFVPVELPAQLSSGITVAGLRVRPTGSGAAEADRLEGAPGLLWADAQTDTDIAALVLPQGVELFAQLRSPLSPEAQKFELDLPAGASLVAAGDGAEVLASSGSVVARVHPPSAEDAQGREVPVDLRILTNSSFEVVTEHRGGDFAYPILVDPPFEDMDFRTWQHSMNFWYFHTNGPGGIYAPRMSCYAPVSCYSGLENSLYIYRYNYVTTPGGVFAEWVYQTPGQSTYISQADIIDLYFTRRDSHLHPYLYTGIWSAQIGAWRDLTTWNSVNLAAHDETLSTGTSDSDSVAVGFYADSGQNPFSTEWRDFAFAGARLTLGDGEAPTVTVTSGDHSGLPTGWTQNAQPSVTPTINDNGLGVKQAQLRVPDQEGAVEVQTESNPSTAQACDGTAYRPCTDTWRPTFNYDTDTMPEGINTITARGIDPLDKQGNATWEVKVDRTAPEITAGGALRTTEWDPAADESDDPAQPDETEDGTPATIQGEAPDELETELISGESYELLATAEDGEDTNPRSGAERLEIQVDGQNVASATEACATSSCSLELRWTLDPGNYQPGSVHTVKILAEDGVGLEATEQWQVKIAQGGNLQAAAAGDKVSWGHQGVNFTPYWVDQGNNADAQATLSRINARTAARHVAFVPTLFMEGKNNGTVLTTLYKRNNPSLAPRERTVSTSSLQNGICRWKNLRAGNRVTIKPHVDVVAMNDETPLDLDDVKREDRGEIDPGFAGSAGGTGRETWWDDYERHMLRYAKLAYAVRADALVIGTELTKMSGVNFAAAETRFNAEVITRAAYDQRRWRSLIKKIRTTRFSGYRRCGSSQTKKQPSDRRGYRGTLIYDANWNLEIEDGHIQRAKFLKKINWLGISSYFPLAQPNESDSVKANMTFDVARERWIEHRNRVRALYEPDPAVGSCSGEIKPTCGKPVVFTEIGYADCRLASVTPYGDCKGQSGEFSPRAQANLYEAAIAIWRDEPASRFKGFYWWDYPSNPDGENGTDVNDAAQRGSFSPFNADARDPNYEKVAEKIICRTFSRCTPIALGGSGTLSRDLGGLMRTRFNVSLSQGTTGFDLVIPSMYPVSAVQSPSGFSCTAANQADGSDLIRCIGYLGKSTQVQGTFDTFPMPAPGSGASLFGLQGEGREGPFTVTGP